MLLRLNHKLLLIYCTTRTMLVRKTRTVQNPRFLPGASIFGCWVIGNIYSQMQNRGGGLCFLGSNQNPCIFMFSFLFYQISQAEVRNTTLHCLNCNLYSMCIFALPLFEKAKTTIRGKRDNNFSRHSMCDLPKKKLFGS